MKVMLTLAIICFSSTAAFTQIDELPEVQYDKQNDARRIFINYKLTDPTCNRSISYNLKLIKIIYDGDETEKLSALIFADNRNRRERFNFDFNFSELSRVDESWAKLLVGENLNYNVGVITCGIGGGGDPYIFSLEPIKKRIIKKRKRTKK